MKPGHLLLAIALGGASCAQADIYRCRTPTGQILITDMECPASAGIDSVRNSEAPTPQQQREAAEVRARRKRQLEAIEAENAAWRQQSQNIASPSAVPQAPDGDEEAIRQCIRDVERQGPSEAQKALLVAACRTAGSNRRQTGTSEETVRNCVRSVERTGATGSQKARQIALCHGGDVAPERFHGDGNEARRRGHD